jgi:hypothetical protein
MFGFNRKNETNWQLRALRLVEQIVALVENENISDFNQKMKQIGNFEIRNATGIEFVSGNRTNMIDIVKASLS